MKTGGFQRNLADGTREGVSGDLLDAATPTRLAKVSGQVVEKSFVEGGEAKRQRHQVRVERRVQRVKRAAIFPGMKHLVLQKNLLSHLTSKRTNRGPDPGKKIAA